ncbi:GNAT family N-acetyltransferase [Rubrobacter calidifluminis]|uniref:GNAT family N-acetyltransferase n=1 Tax=Rubrobacter calidifluminis TaxID=1392640 RepID=UPI00235E0153|nr:GNAT family N-acetyltransferase [Rubrobacter calidifluminis]
MHTGHHTVRLATPEDLDAVATLVIEGFRDQFEPIFGRRMTEAGEIMRRWIELEHELGGVSTLVVEDAAGVVASVGVRTGRSREEELAQGLWETLRDSLGFWRASWSMFLLSYPRYSVDPSEAYVERLVVGEDCRRRGLARRLLDGAERIGREAGKRSVGLHVSCTNRPAISLYESAGYRERSRERSLVTSRFLGVRYWIYLRKPLS